MADRSQDIEARHTPPDLVDNRATDLAPPMDEQTPGSVMAVDGNLAENQPLTGRGQAQVLTNATQQRPKRARRGDIIGGRYVVDGQIGRGGMGRVLRVRHQALGKAFALKLIRARKATDPRTCEMFYREARLASSLSHNNICTIVDFGNDPTFGLFMVMELLEGVSLYDKLRQDGPMTLKAACGVMWEVVDAVHYMHSRSIVHGDIKSENILLMHAPHQRRVKLLDFGLARVDIRKISGTLEGTPQYMAPECVRGHSASPKSDIYALGILFYELLTGSPPFKGEVEEVLHMQLTKPVPEPSKLLGESIDIRTDELIMRATAKSADKRHQDTGHFLYELQTLMNMLGMDTSRRRRTMDASGVGRKRSRSAVRLAQAAAEIFEHAPLPLAAVDCTGKIELANEAFLEFLGVEGDAVGLDLTRSHLLEVYPSLLDDLTYVASSRSSVKRVIHLHDDRHGVVEVAILLSAVPSHATVIAGSVHMTVHPLSRSHERSE